MIEETLQISRRRFLSQSGLAFAALPFGMSPIFKSLSSQESNQDLIPPICISSSCLSWLDFEDVGKLARDVGFDGVELTVSAMGHVHPFDVAKELPRAVGLCAKSDVAVNMINTNITSIDHPQTIPIIATARDMKIKYYKMGHYQYDPKKNLTTQLDQLKYRLSEFSKVNEHYGVKGNYQNHIGTTIGSSIWDLWHLMQNINSDWLGIQFDVGNAKFEGGNSWKTDLKLIRDFVQTITIKNFKWVENEDQVWSTQDVPLGEGLIDFSSYFDFHKQLNINCPITLYLDYPLFNNYQKTMTRLEKIRFAYHVLAKDFRALRNYLIGAGIIY